MEMSLGGEVDASRIWSMWLTSFSAQARLHTNELPGPRWQSCLGWEVRLRRVGTGLARPGKEAPLRELGRMGRRN